MQKEDLKKLLTEYPDYPQKGIVFYDILPIFRNPVAFETLINDFVEQIKARNEKIDVVIGLEARGFILAPLVALRIGAAFVPVRKMGKLPGPTLQASYTKEYGKDIFEIQSDSILPGQNVIVIDDLIATGGTAKAAINLIELAKANVKLFMFVTEIASLKGKESLGVETYITFPL